MTNKDYKLPRAIRGGCWFSDALLCRLAFRTRYFPDSPGDDFIGFRLTINSSGNKDKISTKNSPCTIRGGCWFSDALLCRLAYQYFNFPDSRDGKIGFRLEMKGVNDE